MHKTDFKTKPKERKIHQMHCNISEKDDTLQTNPGKLHFRNVCIIMKGFFKHIQIGNIRLGDSEVSVQVQHKL